eukprot:5890402-Pyramimonas_sp.AAC.1
MGASGPRQFGNVNWPWPWWCITAAGAAHDAFPDELQVILGLQDILRGSEKNEVRIQATLAGGSQ